MSVQERYKALAALCAQQHGNVREAVRALTGRTIADLARRTGVSRSSVNHTLAGYKGRHNPPVRRALELELGIPQYALDNLIQER